METVEIKKYYYPAQLTRKDIALPQSSEVFLFFSVCVQVPLHRKWPLSTKRQLSLQCQCLLHSSATLFLTFLQGIASVSDTAARGCQGHHCLPQVMGRTVLWLHKLDSRYSLRAASSHVISSVHSEDAPAKLPNGMTGK